MSTGGRCQGKGGCAAHGVQYETSRKLPNCGAPPLCPMLGSGEQQLTPLLLVLLLLSLLLLLLL